LKTLTYVIASRNDDWGSWNHELTGTPMRRLHNTMQSIARHHPEAEVIVVDWGSQFPLFDTIRDYAAARGSAVRGRFIYVPTEFTTQFKTPFCEVVAQNIGIRRAKTDWIARQDQDTMIGPGFVEWFRGDIRKAAYYSLRRDLWPGYVEPTGNEQVWRGWPLESTYFYTGSGGILLAPREAWYQVRGYAEHLIHRNNMEHDLCLRFAQHCGFINLGPLVNACFYHQWHPELPTRTDNACHGFTPGKIIPLPNTENWGFADAVFPENTLGPLFDYRPTGFSIQTV
jgi:hypothetical protein